MAEYFKQDCPLCSSSAEYYWVDAHNRKYYHCPICTYFIVSKRAEALLVEAGAHVREAYAARPRQAPEDHLFVILVPSQSPSSDAPRPSLSGSFVPKSEMRL
ncbi:hypothetical protein GCM10010981_30760 [Dyella nitratireducens]|uniref:Uncharacterized protein n=1 Tax=Dyella nitratireducens TaxID=1849580 RepID=A0ABQ1G9I7_9GAMM|nr:hypothetical protein GCM10010981_30760 [Dyella nitratireducens]GLQ40433.1 hypothetical protein GCM10007902_02820 [Dyella nitratireducens]